MFGLGHITGSNATVFDPDNDIPSLHGKVILVTGGSAGLGKQSIIYLARQNPAEIWLAAKTLDDAETACEDIREQIPDAKLKPLQLDLASFKSINQRLHKFWPR
jgi:NAD(P)-dependent dehydrogenase (short-subunit alcohol dehydrogenase family)